MKSGDTVTVIYKGETITGKINCTCNNKTSMKLIGHLCMHRGEWKVIDENKMLTNLLGVVK